VDLAEAGMGGLGGGGEGGLGGGGDGVGSAVVAVVDGGAIWRICLSQPASSHHQA
jgi:hypothetical protein